MPKIYFFSNSVLGHDRDIGFSRGPQVHISPSPWPPWWYFFELALPLVVVFWTKLQKNRVFGHNSSLGCDRDLFFFENLKYRSAHHPDSPWWYFFKLALPLVVVFVTKLKKIGFLGIIPVWDVIETLGFREDLRYISPHYPDSPWWYFF